MPRIAPNGPPTLPGYADVDGSATADEFEVVSMDHHPVLEEQRGGIRSQSRLLRRFQFFCVRSLKVSF